MQRSVYMDVRSDGSSGVCGEVYSLTWRPCLVVSEIGSFLVGVFLAGCFGWAGLRARGLLWLSWGGVLPGVSCFLVLFLKPHFMDDGCKGMCQRSRVT